MELGVDGVLLNTGIAHAWTHCGGHGHEVRREAGRLAYLAGRIPKKLYAQASGANQMEGRIAQLCDLVPISVSWSRSFLCPRRSPGHAVIYWVLRNWQPMRSLPSLTWRSGSPTRAKGHVKNGPICSRKVVVNLFFEPSTRTRTSFGLAARRLTADTLDFTPGSSSLSKGETFIDTAKNIEAMGVDVVVVRHSSPGPAPARAAPAMQRRQRRRRRPRASDAGLAGHLHHSPA